MQKRENKIMVIVIAVLLVRIVKEKDIKKLNDN